MFASVAQTVERRWMAKAVIPTMRPDDRRVASRQAVTGKSKQGQPLAAGSLEIEGLGSSPSRGIYGLATPNCQQTIKLGSVGDPLVKLDYLPYVLRTRTQNTGPLFLAGYGISRSRPIAPVLETSGDDRSLSPALYTIFKTQYKADEIAEVETEASKSVECPECGHEHTVTISIDGDLELTLY